MGSFLYGKLPILEKSSIQEGDIEALSIVTYLYLSPLQDFFCFPNYG